jgi:hypothetical protein
MKTITLLLLLLPLALFAENNSTQADMQWVNQEIAAIKPPRKGVPAGALLGLKDPFWAQLVLNQPPGSGKRVAVVRPRAQRPFTLNAVINSRTAMIDGKWYKQDDRIYGYTIQSIGKDNVLLQKKKKQIKLSLVKYNKHIKINAK